MVEAVRHRGRDQRSARGAAQPVDRRDLASRRIRARLPCPTAAGVARVARPRRSTRCARKYAPRQAALEEKLRRAQQTVERESQQATGQKLQTMISRRRDADGGADGTQGDLGQHDRPRHDRGARHGPDDEGVRGHRARASRRCRRIEEQRQALEDELQAETATLESAGDPAHRDVRAHHDEAEADERRGKARRVSSGPDAGNADCRMQIAEWKYRVELQNLRCHREWRSISGVFRRIGHWQDPCGRGAAWIPASRN